MGSFIGHAIPGSLFFLFGFWWVTQTFRRHFRCRQSRQSFQTTLTFPCRCCPVERLRDLPVESILKILLCFWGIIVEIIGGTNSVTHRFDSVGNTQHITMYFFYALGGVVELLTLKDLAPVGSDYVSAMVALLVEAALFKFHVYGRDALDVLLHTLLVYVIVLAVVVVGLEAAYRHNSLLPLLRGLLFMLQGSWFWGVGFILYNPFPGATPWDPEDHHALMLAVVCFSWHLAVNLILIIIVGGVVFCCYRNKVQYSKLSTVPLDVLGEERDGETGLGLLGRGGEEESAGFTAATTVITTTTTEDGVKLNGSAVPFVYHDNDYSDCYD
ncbi:hypothetical protein ACOMHN_045947 [Nucella lapillus]